MARRDLYKEKRRGREEENFLPAEPARERLEGRFGKGRRWTSRPSLSSHGWNSSSKASAV